MLSTIWEKIRPVPPISTASDFNVFVCWLMNAAICLPNASSVNRAIGIAAEASQNLLGCENLVRAPAGCCAGIEQRVGRLQRRQHGHARVSHALNAGVQLGVDVDVLALLRLRGLELQGRHPLRARDFHLIGDLSSLFERVQRLAALAAERALAPSLSPAFACACARCINHAAVLATVSCLNARRVPDFAPGCACIRTQLMLLRHALHHHRPLARSRLRAGMNVVALAVAGAPDMSGAAARTSAPLADGPGAPDHATHRRRAGRRRSRPSAWAAARK